MWREIRLILTSKRFWGAVIIMLIGFTGYAIFDWIIVYDYPPEAQPSSLQQTIGGIFFGGVMILLPLCSSIPVGTLQVDEYKTAFAEQAIIRTTMRAYLLRKLVVAFICGAAVMGVSFAIHAISWNIIATPCDTTVNSAREIMFSEQCLYFAWQPILYSLPIYISIFIGISFCGGMWSIVSVTAACFIQDKLLAVAVPFCLYYLWHMGLFRVLLGVSSLPHPADLFNDSLTFVGIGHSLVAYAVVLIICVSLLWLRLRWRYRHAH